MDFQDFYKFLNTLGWLIFNFFKLQNAASESTLVALLCGKSRTVDAVTKKHPNMKPEDVRAKLVAYTSKESNSSVEKSSLLASVPMRLLEPDKECRLRGSSLQQAIDKDKAAGLIPCCVVASIGTTGTCSFDDLQELGRICKKESIWLHVDAAYAGAAFICPEYRHLIKGNYKKFTLVTKLVSAYNKIK